MENENSDSRLQYLNDEKYLNDLDSTNFELDLLQDLEELEINDSLY